MTIQPGFYRHYKGTLYRVIGCGIHTETEEPLVFYHRADRPEDMYARPAAMFHETVAHNEENHPRFTLVELKPFAGETRT